jgi:DNA-binding SARP family transcriptional activator
MSRLRITLFGKFDVRCDDQVLEGLDTRKVQELFCYLLLNRDQPHPREALASLLWDEDQTDQPVRCLRKTLWQLRTALDARDEALSDHVLVVEPEWIQLNPGADLWLDVVAFEGAYASAQGVRGKDLDRGQIQLLQTAVDLYRGGLQESWYHDWYLYERERLQHLHLILLDKLMDYCEARGEFEAGLVYGALILRCETARERTHRRLMRLFYASGDRTAALRQYERCVVALKEELGVEPAKRTVALYQQIRADQLQPLNAEQVAYSPASAPMTSRVPDMATNLTRLQTALDEVQRQLSAIIQHWS